MLLSGRVRVEIVPVVSCRTGWTTRRFHTVPHSRMTRIRLFACSTTSSRNNCGVRAGTWGSPLWEPSRVIWHLTHGILSSVRNGTAFTGNSLVLEDACNVWHGNVNVMCDRRFCFGGWNVPIMSISPFCVRRGRYERKRHVLLAMCRLVVCVTHQWQRAYAICRPSSQCVPSYLLVSPSLDA